jgi:hypothetical protein
MSDSTTIAPTANELWRFANELEEAAMRAETLGLGAGPIRRLSINVGELATATERAEAINAI